MNILKKLNDAFSTIGICVNEHPVDADAFRFVLDGKNIGSVSYIPSLNIFQSLSGDNSNEVGFNLLDSKFPHFSDTELMLSFINQIQDHHLIKALMPQDKRITLEGDIYLDRDCATRIYLHKHLTAINCWNMFGREPMYKLNDDGSFSLVRRLSIIIDKKVRSSFYLDYKDNTLITCFEDDFKYSDNLVYKSGFIEDLSCMLELWLATYSIPIYNYIIELNKHPEELKTNNITAAIQGLQTLEMYHV
jgi:hypothetical protein